MNVIVMPVTYEDIFYFHQSIILCV